MKKIALLMCLMLLSGCSWMKFWDKDSDVEIEIEPAKLVDFNPTIKIKKVWSTGGVGSIEPGISNLEAAIGDGAIYLADANGHVVAFNENNGRKLWSTQLDVNLSGGVGFGGGQVLVGSIEGSVFALSAQSGAILWQSSASSEVLAAPASNGTVSVAQTADGRLQAFDAITGSKLWRFEIDVPVLTIRGTSTPLITDNMVLAAFSNGKVYGLKADAGSLLWEARVAIPRGRTELERIVDVDGDMLLEQDVLYAASFQGRLGAFARGTGRALWYQDVSTYQAPGYSLSQVYITDEDDNVHAYRSNSGQPLWTNDQMLYRRLTGPAAVGNYVAVADGEGYLHLLSQIDGSFAARVKVDGSGVSAPIITSGDNFFILDNDGGLTAYTIE